MFGVVKIVIGLALLMLLGLTGIHWTGGAEKAERTLFAAAERVLLDNRQEWARISVDGQNITLSGIAPSPETVEETTAQLMRANGFGGPVFGGVNAVERGDIEIYQSALAGDGDGDLIDTRAQPERFVWRVAFDGERVTISGHVPSKEARELLLKSFERQFQDHEIIDASEPAIGVDERRWLIAADASIRALAALQQGSIVASALEFNIEGMAPDAVSAERARQMMQNLPAAFSAREKIEISAPATVIDTPPVKPAPAITGEQLVEECQTGIDETMLGKQIMFNRSNSQIDVDSLPLLDQLATAFIACGEVSVRIEGHTDSTGRARNNMRLSENRAQAVKTYLIEKGVDERRLIIKGFGLTKPIASNETAAGRAINRRIGFVVSALGDGGD